MEDFAKPEGIVEGVLIDTKTGLLARKNGTIPDSDMRYEIFIGGTEPKEYSPRVKTLLDHIKDIFLGQPEKDNAVLEGTPRLDPQVVPDAAPSGEAEQVDDSSNVIPIEKPDSKADGEAAQPESGDSTSPSADEEQLLRELKEAFGL